MARTASPAGCYGRGQSGLHPARFLLPALVLSLLCLTKPEVNYSSVVSGLPTGYSELLPVSKYTCDHLLKMSWRIYGKVERLGVFFFSFFFFFFLCWVALTLISGLCTWKCASAWGLEIALGCSPYV